jgi:hypothetical protein
MASITLAGIVGKKPMGEGGIVGEERIWEGEVYQVVVTRPCPEVTGARTFVERCES